MQFKKNFKYKNAKSKKYFFMNSFIVLRTSLLIELVDLRVSKPEYELICG